MHATGIEAVPAAALGLLAVAVEISLAVVDIGDVVFAGDVENLFACPFMIWSAASHSSAFERWLISPV